MKAEYRPDIKAEEKGRKAEGCKQKAKEKINDYALRFKYKTVKQTTIKKEC
jgi:hypothetical protein